LRWIRICGRNLRAAYDLRAGEVVAREKIDVLRPATPGAILPDKIDQVIGMKLISDMPAGKEFSWGDLQK